MLQPVCSHCVFLMASHAATKTVMKRPQITSQHTSETQSRVEIEAHLEQLADSVAAIVVPKGETTQRKVDLNICTFALGTATFAFIFN